MVKREKKIKLLLSIMLVSLLFLGHLVSGYTTFADNQGKTILRIMNTALISGYFVLIFQILTAYLQPTQIIG